MKKVLCFGIVLCMFFSVCPTSLANDFETAQINISAYTKAEISVEEKNIISDQLQALNDRGHLIENLTEIKLSGEDRIYCYQIGDVYAELRYEEYSDGGTALYITEGDLSDTVYRTPDGNVFLDGKPVTISYRSNNASDSRIMTAASAPIITPRDGMTWVTEDCPYGSPSEYTSHQFTDYHPDVAFEEGIENITLSAICDILDIALPGYGLIVNVLASTIDSMADTEPGSQTGASFKALHFYHNTQGYYVSNDGGRHLGVDQITMMCYVKTNYQGSYETYQYYECRSLY